MKHLQRALDKLKNNAWIYPNGMLNELFKSDCAGDNLKKGLLLFFNGIKREKEFPEFMLKSDITSIWKRKGSKESLENERGISILNVF